MSGPASVEGCPELPVPFARLFAIAERDARRAVRAALRRQACSADMPPFVQALATYALAYAWLRWERLDTAEALLSNARQQFLDLGQIRLALHVQRAQLYLALLRGSGADHAAEWAKLAGIYEQQGDQISAARARLGQMVQLNLQGLAHESLSLAEHIAPVLERQGSPGDRAWLWRLIGVAHINRAASDDALRCLDQAAALFATLGQRAELAKTWFEHSRLHERHGNIALASRALERASQVFQRLDLPLRIALCKKNLGFFVTLCGEYDRGIQLSLQAYDQLVALDRLDYVAGCDLNLGNTACFAGLWELALMAYRRAEKVYVEFGHRRMGLLCRRNQVHALRLNGQPEAALQLARELAVVAEQLDERMEMAELSLAQGQALADLGHTAAAEREIARAEEQFRTLDNGTSAGECSLERGWLLLRQGRIAQAEECLQRARLLLDEQPIYRWRAEYGLGRCAELRADLPQSLALYRGACCLVAGLRQRLSNEHASSGLFNQARQLVESAIHLAWRTGDAEAALDLAELQRRLALESRLRAEQTQSLVQAIPSAIALDERRPGAGGMDELDPARQRKLLAYLEYRLRQRHALPAADDESPASIDLAQLRAALQDAFPAGWTLLTYVPCANQLLIIAVMPASIEIIATPFDKDLQQLLAQATAPRYRSMTFLLGGAEQATGAPGWPTLAALGDRLLPPQICARLSPDHRLLIVASGVLHGLPWAALRVGGRWLVEQATPHILPGIHIWHDLIRRRPQSTEALLLGVSRFDTRAEDLATAPATLDIVEACWPGQVTRWDEAQASVSALLDHSRRGELRRYGLLHFATHGQLVAASGLYAHLKLADEDLLYDDVLQLGLQGTLVVLAACDGAAAEVLPGEEVLSLSWAFLAAGARDVVASLWQLYDTTAPQILAMVYEQLAAGRDAPTALAATQRAWIVRTTRDGDLDALLSAPLIWAGVCAVGAGSAGAV